MFNVSVSSDGFDPEEILERVKNQAIRKHAEEVLVEQQEKLDEFAARHAGQSVNEVFAAATEAFGAEDDDETERMKFCQCISEGLPLPRVVLVQDSPIDFRFVLHFE